MQTAIDALHAGGANKVFVAGASFGGAATVKEATEPRGVAGLVSLSGELGLPSMGNALPAVRRLHAPLLALAPRMDYYLDAADARRLIRAAGSLDRQLALYPGDTHGWDLLQRAPYKRRGWSRLIDWISAL